MGLDTSFWAQRKVFITGHTGFKGGWASLVLSSLGAKVYGYALPPIKSSLFYRSTQLDKYLTSNTLADIRDRSKLSDSLEKIKPEIVIHMAAQPLVRQSYLDPLETYEVNVIGTANLFEAVRKCNSVKTIINVTTDKCYENKEWIWPYRENDRLGGYDPYSSSKACSEIVSNAYRQSFFNSMGIGLATARAGNVIGGGDWSEDRLVPDFLKSVESNKKINIRSPNAIRPWQHVLEPVTGYLLLAQKVYQDKKLYSGAWNFGPESVDCWKVSKIVESLIKYLGSGSWTTDNTNQPHEANFLKLDNSKAKDVLGWSPKWHVDTAISKTAQWHKAYLSESDMYKFSLEQFSEFLSS